MNRKVWAGLALGIALLAVAIIQFIPAPQVQIPAHLPVAERSDHRLLNFEAIPNFRDLGGYTTADGHTVAWGKLYRAGTFAEASQADLAALRQLELATFIDFRSGAEKREEPDRLPQPLPFTVVEIPVLDDGNNELTAGLRERIEAGDLGDFDPNAVMATANRQFADEFTPQFRQFIQLVLAADGAPVLWHCSAGKDRTGFAAAILLRLLGVPQNVVMQDYMASKAPSLAAHSKQILMLKLFKGEATAEKIAVLLGVEQAWLEAAFDQIDTTWGSFDNYVATGLELNSADIQRLRDNLLEQSGA